MLSSHIILQIVILITSKSVSVYTPVISSKDTFKAAFVILDENIYVTRYILWFSEIPTENYVEIEKNV